MVCQSAPPASSPAPRLRARSMLSFGTEFFLAFWMASYSVGLPPGSPPPTRAATSMFLISRAKFLPRRASMTAFLCFVVAHLEWPLMQVLPLSLTSESDQRVYVDVYALPNGVGRRQGNDAVADPCRPAQVAVDVHLNPGRGTRRVVGEGRGGVDDRGCLSGRPQDHGSGERRGTERGPVIPQAVRDEERRR